MWLATDHYHQTRSKSPYRKGCVNSLTLLSLLLATGTVIFTHILFTLPYRITKAYVETRKQRIEHTTQKLLRPYARQVNSTNIVQLPLGTDIRYDNSTDYSFIYKNHNTDHVTCLVTTTQCRHHHHILILITSSLKNFQRRQSIRATWGEDPISKEQKWKTYFLVGRTKVNEELHRLWVEMMTFGDIVLGDNWENFYNLPPKLQMGFEWSLRYCNFDFLVKGDDDVFVNIPQLFSFVDRIDTPKELLYAGNAHYAAVVGRDGRYGMTKQEYWKDIYPRYCSGGGFVLTRDVVEKFLGVIKNVRVIKIDDAYIGELALRAGVDVFHNDNFAMFESNRRCLYRQSSIVHHPVKTDDCMKSLYERTIPAIIQLMSQ